MGFKELFCRLGLVLVLTACTGPVPPRPLTLPPADGRAAEIVIGDGFRYVVNHQGLFLANKLDDQSNIK